jgi:short-subunit dehydrogenase
MKLDGASTLLTGASGNLGRDIARVLIARGAIVKASGRNVEALEALRAELGERLEVLPADLETLDGIRELTERAGVVDVMVACAGISPIGPIEDHPSDELDNVLDVNLRAPIRLAHLLLPGMKERGRGHLVFISSVSGKSFTPSRSLYSSTSYGLRGFAGCLRLDLRGTGIGVTTILPGPMSKPGDTEKPEFRGDIPPEKVAAAIVRGIERNAGEMVVAPRALKAIMAVTNTFPVLNRFAPTEPEDATPHRQLALGPLAFAAEYAESAQAAMLLGLG